MLAELSEPLTLDNTVRHLLFHLYPINGWKWNVQELKKRLELFNGRKVVMVAQDMPGFQQRAAQIGVVQKLLGPDVFCFPVPNDRKRRETPSFATMLSMLSRVKDDSDRTSIAFYSHGKGVSYKSTGQTSRQFDAVRLWTRVMNHYLLYDMPNVLRSLTNYPVTGCFRRKGRFGNFPHESRWHYAGTFYWFHTQRMLEANEKNPLTDYAENRFAVEAYPGIVFNYEESDCLFGEEPPWPCLYERKGIKKFLEEQGSVITR